MYVYFRVFFVSKIHQKYVHTEVQFIITHIILDVQSWTQYHIPRKFTKFVEFAKIHKREISPRWQ